MKINKFLLIAGATLLLASCGEKPVPDVGPDEGQTKTVTFTPDRETMYRNPLSGWVLYSGLGDGLWDNYWEVYDNFPSSVGNVKVSDYASMLLIRIRWAHANPEDGKYIWDEGVDTKYAKRFRMLVEGAKERNMKLAFNFTADSRDAHENYVPDFVRNAGCQGIWTKTGSADVWSPYMDDPVFQQYYSKFIHAFAEKFDNNDITEYIGGFGIGKWGEYHACIYSTGDEKPREAVFDWACDTFMDAFKNVPVHVNVHRWLGTKTEWASGYDPDSKRLLDKAVDKGLSLQSAAFGMHTYFADWEKSYLLSQRYNRPIVAEGGWVKSSHGSSIKGDGYETYADVRRGEFDDGIGSCVNTMDFRYNSNKEMGETWSWFNEAYDLVKQWHSEGCYRLYPPRITVPESASSGAKVSVSHQWANLGYSYCPTNVPQYRGKYKFALALLNAASHKVVKVFFDETVNPATWTKGTTAKYKTTVDLTGIAPGEYIWATGIVNTEKNNAIGVELAVKKGKNADGWIEIANITIK